MPAPRDNMDAIFAELTPEEVPEFLRGIDLFERCGVLSHEDAEMWRKGFLGWIALRSRPEGGEEAGPAA